MEQLLLIGNLSPREPLESQLSYQFTPSMASFDSDYDERASNVTCTSEMRLSKDRWLSENTLAIDDTLLSDKKTATDVQSYNSMCYQYNYGDLLSFYRQLQNLHVKQLKFNLENTPTPKGERITLKSLPFMAAQIGETKGKLLERNVDQKSINFSYISKKWKKNYQTLIDAIDNIYSDLKFLYNNKLSGKHHTKELSETERQHLQKTATELSGCPNIINIKGDITEISNSFVSDLKIISQVFRSQLERQLITKEKRQSRVKEYKDRNTVLKGYVYGLRNELMYWNTIHRTQIKKREDEIHSLSNMSRKKELEQRVEDLEQMIKREENERKILHNKKQELLGNIRVYCRIRPDPNCVFKTSSDDRLILPSNNLAEKSVRFWNSIVKCFIFDKVFDTDSTQVDVFQSVVELITSCVDGFNVCIMAYGQTGSGKTHTMMGTIEDPGVNRRAITELLRVCNERKHWTYSLLLSMVEIYNEDVNDLLTSSVSNQPCRSKIKSSYSSSVSSSIRIMSTSENGICVSGLSEHNVTTEKDIINLLEHGSKNRKTGFTSLNVNSSRSHLILLLKVVGANIKSGTTTEAVLTLCDLAGSESVIKSGAKGQRFTETTAINRSLTTLGRVFDSLRQRKKPPYRDSKLTFLLKSTLGGDAKCLLLVNVRGEAENIDESVRALNFGKSAMQVAPEEIQTKLALMRSRNV